MDTKIEPGIYKSFGVFKTNKSGFTFLRNYCSEKSAMNYIRNNPNHALYFILPLYFNCDFNKPQRKKFHRQIEKIAKKYKNAKIIIKDGQN